MTGIARGTSSNVMRVATCKDCGREIEGLRRKLNAARAEGRDRDILALEKDLERKERSAGQFSYSEHSATGILDRGGSRSDRCPEHRRKHRTNTQGMAVAYVDLQTIGEALGAHEPEGPTGPFGGLGPLPAKHAKEEHAAKLAEYEFGMTDVDIVGILELLRDGRQRVLVLRAGTGTGKSTFGPYRLMDPPSKTELEELELMDKVTDELAQFGLPPLEGDPYRLTDLGPIVVTEPRVAAATGVSQFVGEKLAMGCNLKQCDNATHGLLLFNPKAHVDDPDGLVGPSCPDFGRKENDRPVCTREHVGEHPSTPKQSKACVVADCAQHIGPGFPVGYQAKGVRHWDDSCQLIYATDGAVINWLRDGRLNKIGTVIVDEAHERSTNIDFIMGYLKRDLARYPHLRVIITSATFEPKFYEEYFGEFHPGLVAVKDIPSVKTVGYGLPLFPDLDLNTDEMREFLGRAADEGKPANHWPEADRWSLIDETEPDIDRILGKHWETRNAPALKENEVKDPREAKGGENEYIEDLWETTRKLIPLRLELDRVIKDTKDWRDGMPELVADFVIRLEAGLRGAKIFGDILAFLPTEKKINDAVEKIKAAVGPDVDVLPLISKLPEAKVDQALAARRKGDPRKIVISTNLAETSLTVEGVRFVVDSGLIAQSHWKPELAAGGVGTTLHSQSGIKQRWGRVGRKAPGWVFPLYTKKQFSELPADTPPGSARENLAQLMMTAHLGGVDDVLNFPWPAAFKPKNITLDTAAQEARNTFVRESHRAEAELRSSGAVSREGYPTALGKELTKFSELGSSAAAMAVLYADRLGCVPEVVMILKLLDGQRLVGADSLFLDDRTWPDEWRVEAYNRHRGLMSLAEDDAHLALIVCAAWEQADPTAESPWAASARRRAWCRQWWVNNDVLVNAAVERQKILALLSPKMKKAVARSVQPALLDRARGVLARTMRATEFRLDGDTYIPLEIPPRLKPDGTADTEPTRFTVEPDSVMKERPERILALRRRENKNAESFISGLIKLPAEPSEHANSSAANAMAMVVEFKEKAPVDKLRDVALTLLKDWPIGQRVRLAAADHALAAQDLKLTVQVEPPFAKPLLTEAEFAAEGQRPPRGRRSAKRRGSDDEDVDFDADASDSAGDFAKRRVRGADEERAAQRAFEFAEQEIGSADRAASEAPCGWCKLCREGRPQFCLEIKRQQKRVVDALKEHREELDGLRARSLDSLTLEFDGEEQPRLFEVTKYKNGASTNPVVVLLPDWRAEGAGPDPSKHDGLHAGKHIEVEVGDTVQDHAGELLTFVRVDGGGRFLLREANASLKKQEERGVIAPSLSAGTSGLLAILAQGKGHRFTATVVPGRVPGAYTITTLQMLNQHWQLGRQGAAVSHVEDEGSRAKRTPYYHAVVHQGPNLEGYLTFRLLHQDSKRGLVHLISHGSVELQDPRWQEGTAHKLALTPDTTPRLDASGVELEGLRKITSDRANGLHLAKAKSGGSDVGDSGESDEEDAESSSARLAYSTQTGEVDKDESVELAPPGTSVGIKNDYGKPLSSKVAEALAALDPDSDDWANRVWSFWARSFHIRLDRNKEVLPGDSTKTEEVAFEGVVLDEEAPSLIADREFGEFAERGGKGHSVTGRITYVDADKARVDLGGQFEGFLPIRHIAHDRVEMASAVFTRGDEVTAQVVDYDKDKRNAVLSTQRLMPTSYELYRQQHEKGEPVLGIVDEIGKVIYVKLAGGVDGSILLSDLSHNFIKDPNDVLTEGHQIRAEIIDFDRVPNKVSLSVRVLYASLWEHVAKHLRTGNLVRGTVTDHVKRKDAPPDAMPFGVIVEIIPGVTGMVHVKEMDGYVPDVRVPYPLGCSVQARVLSVDPQKKSLGLSFKFNAGTVTNLPAWTQPVLSWPAAETAAETPTTDEAIRVKLIGAGLLRPGDTEIAWRPETTSERADSRRQFSEVRSTAVSSAGDGHAEMWVVLDTGEIYHCWWESRDSRWSGWAVDRLPYEARAVVIAGGSHGDWSHDVLVVDSHGQLWHRWWAGNQWSEWQHRPMPAKAVHCGVSSAGEGHSELWVVLDTGEIYHCWWESRDSRWSGWAVDRLPYEARAVVIAGGSHGDWSHDVLVVDSHGQLWHRWWAGNQWSEWQHRPMPAKAVHCGVSSAGEGHSELWVVLDTGDIYHCWWESADSRWSGWAVDRLPYEARAVVIAGGSHGDWSHDVLVVGSHGQLWHRWWAGNQWSEWQDQI